MRRNAPRIEMPENEFASFSLLSPSRAPLNSIPDPSQFQKTTTTTTHLSGFDLAQKLELARTQGPSERRFEGRGAAGAHDSNPRNVARNARSRSEPNSAQSTPTRNGGRVSLGGVGCVTGARVAQSFVGRGRIPRGITMADYAETTPHFEMNEDHSFWKEHNVQVLIRMRPLSTMERASQGHGRCLKQESPQTLLWFGHPETRFTFDHVASETISQEKLFRVAGLPMVENCLSGYNSCVFAYGQTGSGKTYTMMGEISEAEGSLSEDCGVTARIFEYLFSRIKLEEEGRRDEKLRFSCKCSFLEIYNEQITDLLEPSSTNLQLREDFGKGVYVENLVEHNVRTVNDVLKLLLQGAANRKIAATHMNSESSRSHSVFTCTIESIWERDSLTHSRFARLNLVDLAGSERQKSSGAEGDRLKEAANINKSLSTLGLVIMSLVDLAHGKHRHVPYRDSRLTFLLQDSLGGNSKTMIIANVSPSLCSTNETLSTLKFAQRAKLIQNNAKVNEDASGDVTALQQEIRKLKVQLSSLVKSHNSCGALSDCIASLEEPKYSGTYEVARNTQQDKCHCQVNNSLRKKENEVEMEFEDCRKMNSSLVRELDEIQAGLGRYLKFDQIQSDFDAYSTSGAEQAATMSTIGESKEEVCFSESKNCSSINGDTDNPDGNRVRIINESQDVIEENDGSMKLLNNKSSMEREVVPRIEGHDFELSGMVNNTDAVMKADEGADRSLLQFKLRKVIKDLEEAKALNSQYEKEQKLLLSQQQDIEVVREQVETETARTILELQEEMIALESEYQGRICKLTEENQSMKDTITAREAEIRALNQDWVKATLEPTKFIVEGSKSIKDASTQIESIVCSFPQVKRKNPATKMTSRLPFFFSLFLFTVTNLVSITSGATSCRTTCGSIQINYPFGIDKGCGSPQFNGMLNCSSTDLFFFTPSGGYKVRSIDYDKNTMVVFDPLMSTCSILQPHHDFKLSDTQNALIRPSYDTFFALFNCSSVSPVQNRYKSLCFNAAGHSCDELYSSCTSFRIFNTTSPYGNTNSTVHATPYCCFTSYDTVRVMSMNILDCSHYTTVIDDGKMRGVAPIDWSYGMELSYSAPEIGCSPCRKSGGTCGYDEETEIFLCQCPNNVSPRDCGGVSDRGGCNSTRANYAMLFLAMLLLIICAIL